MPCISKKSSRRDKTKLTALLSVVTLRSRLVAQERCLIRLGEEGEIKVASPQCVILLGVDVLINPLLGARVIPKLGLVLDVVVQLATHAFW
jgi:hypothetical protein